MVSSGTSLRLVAPQRVQFHSAVIAATGMVVSSLVDGQEPGG
jgi:hypothetical protein